MLYTLHITYCVMASQTFAVDAISANELSINRASPDAAVGVLSAAGGELYYSEESKRLGYIYRGKITAPSGTPGSFLAAPGAMSSDGRYLATVSTLDDTEATNSGAIYIYYRSGTSWAYQTKLTTSDAPASTFMGSSVAISGNGKYVVAGASNYDTPNTNAGVAFVFARSGSTWTYQTILTPTVGSITTEFGTGVSISDDGKTLVVAADETDSSGVAYVYTRSGSTWTFRQKLVGSDAEAGDTSNISIDINANGQYIALGTPRDDDNGDNAGAVYVFTRTGINTWTEDQKLTADDGAEGG